MNLFNEIPDTIKCLRIKFMARDNLKSLFSMWAKVTRAGKISSRFTVL